jgi:hypothetical protein
VNCYMNPKKMAALFVLLFFAFAGFGQDSTYRFRSVGFTVGTGWQIQIRDPYRPVYFTGDFSWQLSRSARKTFFAFYLEPQFNIVETRKPTDYEFGANIGLRFYQKLSEGFLLYQMLGAGPHYMTAKIQRQASGFLFSDNLAVGAMKRLNKSKPLFLNLQFFVRHLSNAGFQEPNGGINTLNFRLGLSWLRLLKTS